MNLSTESDGTDGRATKDALMIIAAVLALMIGMVMLRFGTNILIDCCILNEGERARTDLIRTLCPWYHRRTQPDSSPNDDAEQERTMPSVEAIPYGIRKDRLMNALPLFHLSTETIQECKVNDRREHSHRTSRDDNMQQGDEDEENCPQCTTTMICSICIHELIPGDSVFQTSNCQHLFHSNCICKWMASVARKNNIECPNCRSRMMTRTALNRILLGGEMELDSL